MIALLCLPLLAVLAVATGITPVDILPIPVGDECGPTNPVEAQLLLQRSTAHGTTGASHRFVTKKVESSKVRFLFFAGLEGTGHHFWHELLERLAINGSKELSRDWVAVKELEG